MQKRISTLRHWAALFVLLLPFRLLIGQEKIDKTVLVVKPYEPTLSDAYKINLMPVIADTVRIAPSFDYSISPRKISPAITVNPIAAAKMGPEQIARLYKSYLKMGFGLYTSPLFELNVSSLRSQKFTLGAFARHHSSHGKLKLENDDKVYAGFADNEVSLYGSSWKKNLLFSGNLDFTSNTVYHYGYNTSLDSMPTFSRDDLRHRMMSIRPGFGVRSLKEDSTSLNFDIRAYYQMAAAGADIAEQSFGLKGRFNRLYEGNWLGAQLGFDYYKPTDLIDTSYAALFSFAPFFNRHSDEWSFQLGFNAEVDIDGGKNKFFLFPQAQLQFHIIPSKLIAWFSADGKTLVHDQLTAFRENPFLLPALKLRNSYERYAVSGGIRGSMGDFSFNVLAAYSRTDQMAFFVNDSANGWGNYFNALYDDVYITRLAAEAGYQMNDKLSVFLRANFYNYSLDSLPRPYHKAPFDGSATVVYNLRDKIIGRFEIFASGKTYSTSNLSPAPLNPAAIKGWVDANIGLEYRYTKVLSGFVNLNNLTASKYSVWHQYPVQRFNLMFGFTYAL